jgi:hypothetical protein
MAENMKMILYRLVFIKKGFKYVDSAGMAKKASWDLVATDEIYTTVVRD